MKIVVIGAVAAGTSAAAKARRNNDSAEIIIYEKDQHISYSGCGLPYFIGGEIEDIGELIPRDPAFFKKKYGIDIYTAHEVTSINSQTKEIYGRDLRSGREFKDTYDKLILATGATPVIPAINGIDRDHVFFLRNVRSAERIRSFIDSQNPQHAVIVGTGFIGFEMLENLMNKKIAVILIEKQSKITPNLDQDMAHFLESILIKKGVSIIKEATISEVFDDYVQLDNGVKVRSDLLIMATGVHPNISLAKQAGVELGSTGAIKVSQQMETNLKDIYACGDCIETFSMITGKPIYRPLGSTANKTGRIAGDCVTDGTLQYKGNLGTGIFKLFDLTIANTGLNEQEALAEGYDIEVCHNIKPDKPAYFQGKEMVIKAIADKKTQKILGVQMIGYKGVDKRIDVFVTLITYGATVDELFHLDLAYAPPFSTTKDPVHYTGMILDNALNHQHPIMTSHELTSRIESGEEIQIIDTRVVKQFEESNIQGSISIPHHQLREKLDKLDKTKVTVTYCNKGVTGNAAQNILLNHGFKKVYNLSGGHKFYKATK